METFGKVPLSFEKLTVSTSVVSLTSSYINPTPGQEGAGTHPSCAYITVEGGSVRFRVDGVDPTTTTGHACSDQDIVVLDTRLALEQFRVIRSGDQDATLQVTYCF